MAEPQRARGAVICPWQALLDEIMREKRAENWGKAIVAYERAIEAIQSAEAPPWFARAIATLDREWLRAPDKD